MSTAGERRKGERQNSPPKSSNSRSTSRRRLWNGRKAGEEANFCEDFTETFAASFICMPSFGLNRSIDASLLGGRDAFIQIKRARPRAINGPVGNQLVLFRSNRQMPNRAD